MTPELTRSEESVLDLAVVPRRAVLSVSGGLDSTVMAYLLHSRGSELVILSVDYGQRHVRELESATATALALGARQHRIDLRGIGALLAGSALTDEQVAVPDGHYTDESMRATVVPNRNALLLDLAVGVAVSVEADAVVFGVHAGDHTVYPDCRPDFVRAYSAMALVANEGFLPDGFRVMAPFLHATKTQIVSLGAELGVPLERTWSCYRGGKLHCGVCGTCVERREAFVLAGVVDPTEYAVAGQEG
ncbi:7-cyano-7-deazaguanine synthase QueC [Micromonospora sp. NPDC051925]|uniref:7-cyano-7-deazaguanine synthase QueC n=1 Tax=Micromonospora sp. NPDC051925 TaxID=3364288 RepID=UPI0037C7D98D